MKLAASGGKLHGIATFAAQKLTAPISRGPPPQSCIVRSVGRCICPLADKWSTLRSASPCASGGEVHGIATLAAQKLTAPIGRGPPPQSYVVRSVGRYICPLADKWSTLRLASPCATGDEVHGIATYAAQKLTAPISRGAATAIMRCMFCR